MIPVDDRKKGFIMVEALVGIFLLATIVLYSISSFVVGKYVTRLSKERFIVSNLLREDMENFLTSDYLTIAVASVSTDITINDGVRTFTAHKTLDCSLGTGVLITDKYGYKKIYGKIEWTGGISRTQTLLEEMVMYVTNLTE